MKINQSGQKTAALRMTCREPRGHRCAPTPEAVFTLLDWITHGTLTRGGRSGALHGFILLVSLNCVFDQTNMDVLW